MFRFLTVLALAVAPAAAFQAHVRPQTRAAGLAPLRENFNFLGGEDPIANTSPEILGEVNYQNFVKNKSGVKSPLVGRTYPLLQRVKELKLLSKTADSGLLSKLEAQGVTLSQLEKALPLAEELGVIDLIIGNEATLLNSLGPLAVEPAPILLPLLASAVSIPPSAYSALALALVGIEGYIIYTSDSLALDVLAAIPLFGLGGIFFTVGNLLGSIKKA